VIFTIAATLTGGSKRTEEFATKHRKPCLHLPRHSSSYEPTALILQRFVEANGVLVLNAAGTRASKEPAIWKFAYETLENAFFLGASASRHARRTGRGIKCHLKNISYAPSGYKRRSLRAVRQPRSSPLEICLICRYKRRSFLPRKQIPDPAFENLCEV
jgi:hypothetical protein